MELKEARRKKYAKPKNSLSLPIITLSDNTFKKFKGYFNDFSVVITDKDEMQKLNNMGCFGKGNLSRGYPIFHQNEMEPQIIRKRVFSKRKEWGQKQKTKPNKVIVVPDSESENEDYFKNLKPEYQLDYSCLREVLNLSLEEAFFLSNFVKCLDIYYENNLLKQETIWQMFIKSDKRFIHSYPVYHYFRSKNWIVKTGLKFGGDFLLYKEGPTFYHASYLVIIDVLDNKTLKRRNDMSLRSMEMPHILGLNRLCETVGKELLICQLLWPSEITEPKPDDISKLSINEVLMERWIPSQNRESHTNL